MKESSFVQFFYNLPGVRGSYHFLWAWIGGKMRRDPSKKIFVIGITGTKGKTTTLELLNSILEAAGKKTALISSLREKIGDDSHKNAIGNSMPGRGYLQKFLAQAVRARCRYALIEVTSQGAVLHRHRFIEWNIGAITNLHPEHIEWHGSFEKYRKAKLDFLRYVIGRGGKVFLNREDENYGFFLERLQEDAEEGKVQSYSHEDEWLRDHLPKMNPHRALADTAHFRFLQNPFNEKNIAVAVAIAKELGISDSVIEEAILNFRGVPGRMEFVAAGPYTGVVDYAHTPESLTAAYLAAKPEPSVEHAAPQLICVLGAAGGGRDRWKRPEFGRIAAEHCDEIILTDEDPYDEDPAAIIKEVRSGILGGDPDLANVHEIADRREAIAYAVSLMKPGDVVIATGKGSEDCIHAGRGKKVPWNERKILEEELSRKNRES